MTETTRPEPRSPAHGIPAIAGVERLHLRNYDGGTAYDVTVTVRPDDGADPMLERTYHLAPGDTAGESDDLDPGRYVVTARTDSGTTSWATCQIDESFGGTALIELGNGAVSVSEGFR